LPDILNKKIKHTDKGFITVYWPKTKCRYLTCDLVLVDSPGVDTTPYLDECIHAYCTDVDVFVLVVNAESELMNSVSKLYILKIIF